ncbi:MAG: DUF4405 domain-containing protein [Calditrichaeota bacterium]|nr:DUF4405 domain-containing protein [Calditrichota bacterium]RQW01364.1 MAG: DUF4405 domain-containing protein [Calditrichota bacterium]
MARPVRFNMKAFFSFLVVFGWLILIITGIVLYFAPAGRIANWVQWRFLGLTKDEWQAVHTIFAFAFIITGAFYLYYNWVIFWSYIKRRLQEGMRMRRELVSSSLLIFFVLTLVIAGVPPFKSIMDFGEYLSDSWASESTEPPIPHAELMTLAEYAQKTNGNVIELMRNLEKAGIQQVDSSIQLEKLAELNGLSPQQLIEKVRDTHSSAVPMLAGYGRRTVSDIADELGIDISVARERLAQQGISFEQQELIKDMAERNNILPLDIVKIMRGEKISGEE